MPDGPQGVVNRRMNFCPALLSAFDTSQLYHICPHCHMFLCICCPDYENPTPCHHYPVVFTDGACSGNGYSHAVCGIGGTFGELPEFDCQWSLPVDGDVDPSPIRSSQRAELLAAIEGICRLGDVRLAIDGKTDSNRSKMVLATDSEYVCKGVTEWMPRWKVRFFHVRTICASDTFAKRTTVGGTTKGNL
jgi:ribonuclease HI